MNRTRFTNAAWRAADLQTADEWSYTFQPAEQAEILELAQRLESDRWSPAQSHAFAKQDHGQAPKLRALMARIRSELQNGRGFVLMRGFPLDGLSPTAIRLAYAAMGSLLGVAMPQNRQGELIHDVRDTGANRTDPNVRLSTTNAEQDFHTDGADLIGLLCLQKAKAGGVSRIVSSVTVFNEIAAARPDLAGLLFEPWYFHMKGEQPPGAPPYFKIPVAHQIGEHLSSFFIGWYIRHAGQLDGVPPLTSAQCELLDLYEETANRPDLYLDMQFEPGDIQWLKNSVTLHKRTEYEDWSEPHRKRHLLRLWLAAPDFRDGIVALRQGHQAAA